MTPKDTSGEKNDMIHYNEGSHKVTVRKVKLFETVKYFY